MKMVKSLLLGTAAGFVALAGAQAPDLPGKAAPATYVKVCDTYGAGYYYIPGSNTCLSISGVVAAAFTYTGGFQNATASGTYQNSFVYATVNFDARTQTEYGLLRSVIGFQGQRGSSPWGAGASNAGTTGAIQAVYPSTASWFALTNAFIQLGGLTAGYAPSFYNAAPLGWSSLDFGTPGPNNRNTLQFAYTASFGGGFLASIAIEDPRYRRTNATAGYDVGISVASTTVLTAAGAALPGATTYAGTVLPNFVAALRVEQGWGSAQISGALQELRAYNSVATVTTGSLNDVSTGMGFALGGGLTINLPQLAKGDYITLSANYTNGATGYLFNRTPRDGGILASSTLPVGIATATIEDFRYGAGALQTVTGFSVFGSLRHYFTPAVYGTLFGDYITVSAPAAYTGNAWQHLLLGANVAYMPVKGFTIGLEASWQSLNATNSTGGYTTAGQAYDTALTGMLFAKREF